MTSKTSVGDIRSLVIFKYVFEQKLTSEQQSNLMDWLENNEALWEITDSKKFDNKMEELTEEWKAKNVK